MTDYKVEYLDKKNQLMNVIVEVTDYYKGNGDLSKVNVLETIGRNLLEEEFTIVVVGEFSAGKSTFLNALMGKNILPSYSGETTATVNFLRHVEKNNGQVGGKVHFRDGSPDLYFDDIGEEYIQKYVTTKGNNVANTVDYLELFLDSDFLKDNVTLVDSPGLNGVADKHREITEEQIEKSNAGIFMFRAKQPGSASEFRFLKDLKQRVNTVFYLLNQIDLVKKEEGDTVDGIISGIKESYKKEFPNEVIEIPEIYGISAQKALAARSGFLKNEYTQKTDEELEEEACLHTFETRLMKFLTQGEKGREVLLSPAKKLEDYMVEEIDRLDNGISVLENGTDTGEIEAKILELREQKAGLESKIKEKENEIQQKVAGLRSELANSLSEKMDALSAKYIADIDEWASTEDLENFEDEFGGRQNRDFAKIIEKLDEEMHDRLSEIIADNYLDFATNINAQLEDINYKVDIKAHYEKEDMDIDFGIQTYEEKISALEEQIANKEKEIKDSELRLLQKKNDERQLRKMQSQLENIKSEQSMYQTALTPPQKRVYSEQVVEARDRNGVLGAIAQFLVGQKREINTVERVDDSDYRAFKAEEQERNSRYEQEKAQIKFKMAELDGAEVGSEEENLKRQQLEQELFRMEKTKDEMRKKHQEEFQAKVSKILRKKKNMVRQQMDEIAVEAISKAKKELREKEQQICGVILHAINCEISKQIDSREADLQLLEKQLKSSVDERNRQLEKDKQKRECAKALLEKVNHIREEIEAVPIDCINNEIA